MHALIFDNVGNIDILVLDLDIALLVGHGVVEGKGERSSSDPLVDCQCFASHEVLVGLAVADVVDGLGLAGIKMRQLLLVLLGNLPGGMLDVSNVDPC